MGKFRYNKHQNYNRHVRDDDHHHSVEDERPPQRSERSHRPVENEPQGEMTHQYGKEDLPNPQKPRFAKTREDVKNNGLVRQIQEWNARRNAPPTVEEIHNYRLKAERERLKTAIQSHKSKRRGMMFASYSPRPSGSAKRSYQGSGYGMGGMGTFGFGNGSLFRSLDTKKGSRGSFSAGTFGKGGFSESTFGGGMDTMLGSFGSRGTRQSSKTRSRAQPMMGLGSNLGKMFSF